MKTILQKNMQNQEEIILDEYEETPIKQQNNRSSNNHYHKPQSFHPSQQHFNSQQSNSTPFNPVKYYLPSMVEDPWKHLQKKKK